MSKNNTDKKFSNAKREIAKGTLALGQLAANPLEAISSASKIVAGLVQGQGASILSLVVEDLASKGEIDANFIKKSKGRYFFQEINDAVRREDRDEDSLLFKIKLFLSIISKKYSGASEDEAKEIWRIVKSLSTKDIRLLASIYLLHNEDALPFTMNVEDWDKHIAEATDFKYSEFVEQSRIKLKSNRLLRYDTHGNVEMSELGICVAEYLEEGERLFSISNSESNNVRE